MEQDIKEILTALSEQMAILIAESKEQRKFRLKVEDKVIPQIDLLADGFKGYSDRVPAFDKMASDIDTMKTNIDVIKTVVKQHSDDIIKLKVVE